MTNKNNQNRNYAPIFIAIYYALVLAASAFLYFKVTYQPEKSEFAGVYLMVITLPWSILLVPISVFIKSTLLKIILLILCSIPNARFINKLTQDSAES